MLSLEAAMQRLAGSPLTLAQVEEAMREVVFQSREALRLGLHKLVVLSQLLAAKARMDQVALYLSLLDKAR